MPNPNLPFWTNGWTTTMNIYSEVGLITLVGLIVKNGILIVQFANELQRQGRTKIQAIRRNSIGIIIVAGMTIGTFFTLLVIPSIYILIAKDHTKERLSPVEK
jgi:multidrug efflux pump